MNNRNPEQEDLWGYVSSDTHQTETQNGSQSKRKTQSQSLPDKLGKAVKLPVPDFGDPNRPPTCLEIDFPISQINALSNLEGNAGKPIYQMSKWWARRRSSVFRSILIAAATQAPADPNEAAKVVWDHYYCNHQKAGSFKHLKVLDCFMGGGTTLVEGSRLGMHMTGIDLNPVAWFVVKNELACSDPEQLKALFEEIERQVKPQIHPFYTTTCPRGHQGRWLDVETGETVNLDPMKLPPDQRSRYRWDGPEIIYTFWAKHGSCLAKGCGHRTPIFRTPVIAEKNLTTDYAELVCPKCEVRFHAELGETRMAPAAERVIAEHEMPFTELTQPFANLLNDYDKGGAQDTIDRMWKLKDMVEKEPGLHCPQCGTFAGRPITDVLDHHAKPSTKTAARKKKHFALKRKPVQMYLLVHPEWLKGAAGVSGGEELGGWAGAPPDKTTEWYEKRIEKLDLVEVRGSFLAKHLSLNDGTYLVTGVGTVPQKTKFSCGLCGRQNSSLTAIKATGHTAPISAYTLQCYCSQCKIEGYNYEGRYFKTPDEYDINRLAEAEKEWHYRSKTDLSYYWPQQKMKYGHMTHERNPLPDHGYTHWWMLFNNRQLLVHAVLLKAITEASKDNWSLDVREQALGAFQQYLRNQNMFSIWNIQRDTPEPFFSEGNYNPKNLIIENSVFPKLGRGNWQSSSSKCIDALEWTKKPWERLQAEESATTKSMTAKINDPIVPGVSIHCGSSTDLGFLTPSSFDLVITDPPFGNNYFYADLADFFYVWLQLPLRKWYTNLSELRHFESDRTPHSMEAIDNPAEHPDDRGDYEKVPFIKKNHLNRIRELTGEFSLAEKDPNPLYRPHPSSDFYSQTLSAVWEETGRRLKDGGIMAFTFHHNDDQAWLNVLKALFHAGYVLLQTFPVIGDESKGEKASFGSKKIEYDIIHVCRKRLDAPEPVSWARMRRWVKDETVRLKNLLEHTHAKTLSESDLRVILRGKSLEFYSRHYGQVLSGDGQVLEVREALLGINQLLDDLLEDPTQIGGLRPPDSAEPASRLYLRLFKNRTEMDRDELHKTLRGSGISSADLESKGWIRIVGRTVHMVPIHERMAFFTERGRNRKVIKTDLDQAHFLIGAASPQSGLKVDAELSNPNFRIKKSVDDILVWYAETDNESGNGRAAQTAAQLVRQWRASKGRLQPIQQTLFDLLEEDV